jgi:hypothetical protein
MPDPRGATPKLCSLQIAVGHVEACPGEPCPFWEGGGAVVDPGCAVERLGLTAELDSRPDLAAYLLELRARLERVRDSTEEREVRSRFYRLLNESEEAEVA